MNQYGSSIFLGAATALVTPFDDSGKIDRCALHKLVEKQVNSGISAIVSCGTTGEPATMTLDERCSVVRETVRAAEGKIPIICGTGSNNTAAVIENERRMRDLGCAAQLVVTPYYNRTTQEGLYRHFSFIAEHTELPMIIYNVPSRTNVDISAETLKRLSVYPNIRALKESSYQLPSVMEKMQACEGNLDFYCGNDDMVYSMLALGAKGVISVVTNLYPERMIQLVQNFFEGKTKESRCQQFELLPLVRALFHEVSPIPVKFALQQLGLCGGTLRLPLCEAGEETRKMLLEAVKNLEENA